MPALCTHFQHSALWAGVQSPAMSAPAGVLQEALSLQAAAAAREEKAMADFATPSHTTPVVSGHYAGKAPSDCCRLEVQALVLVQGPPGELSLGLMGLPGAEGDIRPVPLLSVASDCCVSEDAVGLCADKRGDALFRAGVQGVAATLQWQLCQECASGSQAELCRSELAGPEVAEVQLR